MVKPWIATVVDQAITAHFQVSFFYRGGKSIFEISLWAEKARIRALILLER